MSATDNGANCDARIPVGAFGFGLDSACSRDMRREALVRVGPKSDNCEIYHL